jgi:hypothetical protein
MRQADSCITFEYVTESPAYLQVHWSPANLCGL